VAVRIEREKGREERGWREKGERREGPGRRGRVYHRETHTERHTQGDIQRERLY